MAQQLEVFQSIWAMERRRPDDHEWSLDEQVAMIASAGFDGIDISAQHPDESRAARRLMRDAGLGCTCYAFPDSVSGFQRDVDLALELEAQHLNLIIQIFPVSVSEGVDIIGRLLEIGRHSGMPLTVETHRNCITTDLLYTLQLMESLPEMAISADLSHYVVEREFTWPVPVRDEAWMQQVLARAVAFQGRVASREQIQIQVDFPQHQGWVSKHRQWWKDGMRHWRAREDKNAVLNFLTQLGPPPYAITGRDGYELSDRWQESITIMNWAREMWTELECKTAADQSA